MIQPISMRTILCGALIALVAPLHAQVDEVAQRYAATITQADLRKHLEILASDAYEGRETGMKGQKMAAAYLEQQFRSFGIPPVPDAEQRGMRDGYQQAYDLELTRPGGIRITVGTKPYEFMKGYFYFSEKLQYDLAVSTVPVVTPATVDQLAKGEGVALVLEKEEEGVAPGAVPGGGLFRRIGQLSASAAAVGVQVLLYATADAAAMQAEYGHYINSPRMELKKEKKEPEQGVQVIIVTQALAEDLLRQAGLSWTKALKRAARKPVTATVPLRFTYAPVNQELQAENVLAYIEGGARKDEVVIVTAHYDHIGMADGEVYNGADDDGSGTVALLEMAEAFAKAKAEGHGPLRSILFMPVSGEEKGLLGSEYYSEHPVFPLANTVADVNIDMIGRVDTLHKDGHPYVYVIGSDRLSSELHAINEHANSTYTKLDLDYTFNAENDPNRFYYRSDHYNFAKNGIPSVFFFSGVHEDYHGPKDEVDRIRFDLLEQRTLLVFYTAWELANRPQRIVVDRPMKKE